MTRRAAGASDRQSPQNRQGDLYGHRVRLRFTRRLRDEQRFAGLDELKAQIAMDVTAARKVLGV